MTASTLEGKDELSWTEDVSQSNPRWIAWALMLPFVFFCTRGFFSFLLPASGDAITGSSSQAIPITRDLGMVGYMLFPGIAYAVVLSVLLFNFRGVCKMAIERKMLTFLALLTILSAAWSQNPVRTLYSGGFYLVGTLFAYYLVLRFSPEEIMRLVKMTGVSVCLLGAVVIVLLPSHGINNQDSRTVGAWIGIFQDRVSAAKCIVYLLSPALILGAARSRWRNLLYAILLMCFIVKAKAVSALGVVFLYAVFMAALQVSRRLERYTALILGVIVGAFCISLVIFGMPYLGQILGYFGRDLTLTGRTTIWAILLESIAKHPLLGYGYYAFWQGLTGESANVILAANWFFGYAHNGLLEIALQLGLVGTTVFLLTFVKACRDAWYCIHFGRTAGIEWYCGLLVLAVLYNVDEETVLWPNDLLSILYIVACCGLAVEAKRIRERRSLMECDMEEPAREKWLEATAA